MSVTINTSRVMLAGTNSGCGKTTTVCALLRALKLKGERVGAYKCGPDYIDPMFHARALGVPSHNLDAFMCSPDALKYILSGADGVAVLEGVMGLYDGLGFEDDFASSNCVALMTQTPALLVVGCKGASLSAAAMVNGFRDFGKNTIAGVILNGVSAAMYPTYKKLIEDKCALRVYGHLPNMPEARIESRHLGLITAGEIEDIEKKLDILGNTALETLDIEGILALAASAPNLSFSPPAIERGKGVKIAVAMDKAFCFYYSENLELLQALGAELCYFSPLNDDALPEGAQGLYLGGGYPEVYAEQLSANKAMLQSVHNAVLGGLPTIAECGGFMYLQQSLEDESANAHEMVGALPARSFMTKRLQRFGYATLTAKRDNLLLNAGDSLPIHEFHYSDSTDCGSDCSTKKRNGKTWDCAFATDTLFALYPHLHFLSNPDIATRFLQECL